MFTIDNKYPGLMGYGLKGVTGNPGLKGFSVHVTSLYGFDSNASEDIIKLKILNNKALDTNDNVTYIQGDHIIDNKGVVYIIDKIGDTLEEINYSKVSEIYTESMFINTNHTNTHGYKRIYPNKGIINSYNVKNDINDNDTNSIYGTKTKNFSKNIISNINSSNKFSSTNEPHEVFLSKDKSIAISTMFIKDSTYDINIGNDNKNANLYLDFNKLYFGNNKTSKLYKVINEKQYKIYNRSYIINKTLCNFIHHPHDLSFTHNKSDKTYLLTYNPFSFFKNVDINNLSMNVCLFNDYNNMITKFPKKCEYINNTWILTGETTSGITQNTKHDKDIYINDIRISDELKTKKIRLDNNEHIKNIYIEFIDKNTGLYVRTYIKPKII